MTNGGSANFCLRESSIKVSQLLTMCCHFKVEFYGHFALPAYYTLVSCACLKDQVWRKGGKDTLLYLHAAPSPVRRFKDI